MPNRILREGILTSEAVNRLSLGGEVFYRRLMSAVDDQGRYAAHPALLRAKLYPLRIDSVGEADVSGWLAETSAAGLVAVYEVGGKAYLEVTRFGQRTRTPSKVPDPSIGVTITIETPRSPARSMSATAPTQCAQAAGSRARAIGGVGVGVGGGERVDGGGDELPRAGAREAPHPPPGERQEEPLPDTPTDPPQKPKRSSRTGATAVSPDEQLVLDALNAATGRAYRVPSGELRARVREAGVEACLLVVAYLTANPKWGAGGDMNEYFDTTTPFGPKKWGDRIAKAEAWDRAGRPASTSNGSWQRPRAIDGIAVLHPSDVPRQEGDLAQRWERAMAASSPRRTGR